MEEYAYVLDYLPQGAPNGNYERREPLCYALGETEFKLFELVAKPKAVINFEDRVYLGKDPAQRAVIDHVKRRVGYDDLTSTAQAELDYAIADIVKANEARFVRFYNEAGPISMRKHLLEELPGLGKKSMQAILDDRTKNGSFRSFADITARVPVVKNPEKLIAARISLEITDPARKRYLFVSR
ncbi:MAG: DUF655 domain-containing protein [Candidatus Methanomethylophilus sp.]|nr:DUF655 domain-containing protein [Methanomethylophilus sp.]MDD3232700.1 DUF655 domain-containing protein [Methanomethylophilus sp.]MDD4221530.1 DUF655 domain-containing protein [Methanomethylophilus sp.]MDD4668361.1 DUF655 domain-containing protein [Methanomethylophilus sp.]